MTKTLFIDIETSPNLAHVWDLWNQNIGLSQLMESGQMLCFAACWLDKPDKMIFYSEWEHGHSTMVKAAWTLLDEADVVVHYNGKRFDVPWLQREFVELELSPPAPFRQVDLYSVVRSQFRFPSNKLEYVANRLLGVTKVKHTGHSLWVGVMNGEKAAQILMRRYCKQDVKLLVPLYYKLLAWAPRIPNQASYAGEDVCPGCGSANLRREGYATLQTRKYPRFQCRDCGKWSRGTRSVSSVTITETPFS